MKFYPEELSEVQIVLTSMTLLKSSHQINDPTVLTPSNNTDRLEFLPSCANKLGEKEIKEFLSS